MNVTVQMLLRVTDPALAAKSDAEIVAAVKRLLKQRRIPPEAQWQVLRLAGSWEDLKPTQKRRRRP